MIPRWLLKIKLIAIATILIVIVLNHNILTGEHRSPQAPSRLGARSLAEETSAGSHRFHGGVTVTKSKQAPSSQGGVPSTAASGFESQEFRRRNEQPFALTDKSIENSLLPLAKVHPLPTSLAEWEDKNNQEDYFNQIQPTPLGYLIWSQFPVKIYVAKPTLSPDNSASNIRQQQWIETVRKAIAEWSIYLPLQKTDNPELADITIARSTPERKVKLNPATGLYDIPRAITAQTSYQFYWQDSKILSHRMTIKVSPNLSQPAILAATRHELGHALGIWGHSPDRNDALYFSQVRDFPPISARDINTLKKIYQQPTKLGWIKFSS